MENPHVVILGGGFAGLSAAVALSDAGMPVTVLESRNSLGGRARSFQDPASGDVVDNGQHLFMAAYRETMAFLTRLGMQDRIILQNRLRVDFIQPGGKKSTLDCPMVPAPWHLILGLARLSSLSWKDRWNLNRVFQAVKSFQADGVAANSLDQETVREWLTRLGQSEQSCVAFWDPLVIATLNEHPMKASALGLMQVLKVMLTEPPMSSRLGMASVGLTDLYAAAAQKVIEEKGGQVRLNCSVTGLKLETANGHKESRVTAVILANGIEIPVDQVISALPPSALARILPPNLVESDPIFRNLRNFKTSPIISINLWLDRPVTDALFVGMIGTRTQWLFNKEALLAQAGLKAGYISFIISAAHDLIDQPNDALIAIATQDLRACFPAARAAQILRAQVVREREATVSLVPGTQALRPLPTTSLANLFLAGDWTATSLPATIESAVVSGRRAAHAVLNKINSYTPYVNKV